MIGKMLHVLHNMINKLLQVYSDLSENPYEECDHMDALALTGEVNEQFTSLKKWILKTIKSNQVYCIEYALNCPVMLAYLQLHNHSC